MSNEQIYRGKICVVTGAASGIGRALALALHKAGAILAISDIDGEGLAKTAERLGGTSANTLLVDTLDIANADEIERYGPHVKASLGPADYLFNVAGLTRIGNFDDSPLGAMEKVIDVNFWGAVRMCKAFLPQLKATKGGIVNVASLFSLIGVGGQTHYCASKFALRGFSESLVQELADFGVGVSVVCPGAVDTNITRNAEIDALPARVKSHEHINNMFKKIARTSA
ncbi:MAG TPA: SDR family oxidoreductase, partial [Hellea balneolensis]|nr:SDR family oxidoreductase [Hellea balneolensis]